MSDRGAFDDRPHATPTPEPEVGLKPQADDPITTTVTTAKLEQHAGLCGHGLPQITLNGERWHQEPKGDADQVDVYVPCVAKKKGAR